MRLASRFRNGRFACSRRTAPANNPWAAYAANGAIPDIFADFRAGMYKGLGPQQTAFEQVLAFSRGSSGAFTDASGTLVHAGPDVPRMDHVLENGQWAARGLLLESETRSNALKWSADFHNPVWTASRASVATNAGRAPDGAMTACQLTSTTASFDGAIRQSASYSTGETLSFSVYGKAGDRAFLFLRERTNGFAKDSYFDLQNGTLGMMNSVHTARIENVGSGWFRCSITVTATRTATSDFEIYNSEDNANTASAQPGFTYIWGAQLERGAAASSYIATQGTVATRSADSLTLLPGQLVDPVADGGVSLLVRGDAHVLPGAAPVQIARWGNESGDRIKIEIVADGASAGQLDLTQSTGGTTAVLASSPGTVGPGVHQPFAIATCHGETLAEGVAAGQILGPVATQGIPDIGTGPLVLGPGMMGHLTQVGVWRGDRDVEAIAAEPM